MKLRPCFFSRWTAVSLVRYKSRFVSTAISATAIYLCVRFEWAVAATEGHSAIKIFILLVREILPRHLAVVVGLSSGDVGHWAAAVTVFENVVLVFCSHVRFRCIKAVSSCRGMTS
jgi:hypothetical protein